MILDYFCTFQGRILYDMILYNKSGKGDKPSYLIECEKDVIPEFISMMKKYKIRKKVYHEKSIPYLFYISNGYKLLFCMVQNKTTLLCTIRGESRVNTAICTKDSGHQQYCTSVDIDLHNFTW